MQGARSFDEVALRWHDLAQRRLSYYNELYRSGRWTHFYANQQLFALRMLDVIKAAKQWSDIVGAQTPQQHRQQQRADDLRSAA